MQTLGVWACVVGVGGPLTWEYTKLSATREEIYRVVGVVVALLPIGVAVALTAVLVFTHVKVRMGRRWSVHQVGLYWSEFDDWLDGS